jgi:hypothetical protein
MKVNYKSGKRKISIDRRNMSIDKMCISIDNAFDIFSNISSDMSSYYYGINFKIIKAFIYAVKAYMEKETENWKEYEVLFNKKEIGDLLDEAYNYIISLDDSSNAENV